MSELIAAIRARPDVVRFHAHRDGDWLVVGLMETATSGDGTGTAIMQQLCAWADANQVDMALTPARPGDISKRTTSRGRLRRFYKRFGFVDNSGRNRDWTTRHLMIRRAVR